MKFTKAFGFAAGLAAIASLAACSSDNEPSYNNNETLKANSLLVGAPTIKVWSGDVDLTGGTRGARMIVAQGETPAAVSEAEVAAAKAYFSAKDNWKPATGGSDLDISDLAGWSNYYVQEVTSGNRLPNDIAIYVGTNDEVIDNIAIWNLDADDVIKLLSSDAYLNNDAKVNVNPSEAPLVTNHPIKDFSFESTGYTLDLTYMEGVRSSGHKGQYDFSPNYKIATLDGQEDAVYVALYAYTDQNNGFWNRIIKITKAEVADVEEELPGENEGDVVVDESGLHNNEVEVNLAINDTHRYYEDEDLSTKLSIHVRAAKDVKVRIPVPVEILVPVDDLDIVVARPDLMNFGEENHASLNIGGHTVDLFVDFTEATDCAGNGYGYYIEVTTKGINKDVLDFCMENYGDGLNFEIFNYYQWNVVDAEGNAKRVKPTAEDIAKLKTEWLDKSFVEFGYDDGNGNWMAYTNVSDYPYYYINAFHSDSDSDCVVKVISNQSYAYENHYVGPHLNGSDSNVVYVRNDIYGTERQDGAHQPK